MKLFFYFNALLWIVPFAEATDISVQTARAGLPGYSIQDQHDTLSLALIDVLGEIEIDHVDAPVKKERLARLTAISRSGSVSDATVKEVRWEVEVDEVHDKGRVYRAEAIRKKLASLEALAFGNTADFLEADLKSNEAQFHYFEAELEAAQVDEAYWADRFKHLDALAKIGAGSSAEAKEAGRQMRRSTVIVSTWRSKCNEQNKQLNASHSELRVSNTKP